MNDQKNKTVLPLSPAFIKQTGTIKRYTFIIVVDYYSAKFILGFIVLKLYVQTIFNPHFHLDGGVEFRVCAECVNHNVQLFAGVI